MAAMPTVNLPSFPFSQVGPPGQACWGGSPFPVLGGVHAQQTARRTRLSRGMGAFSLNLTPMSRAVRQILFSATARQVMKQSSHGQRLIDWWSVFVDDVAFRRRGVFGGL
jgi:hypothetical protein